MTRVFSQAGEQFRNSGKIDEPILIDAAGVMLTNADSGRITGSISFARGGSTLVNELGGQIRPTTTSTLDTVAVTGSSGSDTIINAGLIYGTVKLGDGSDSYVDRDGQVGGIDLGAGDDLYRVEGAGFRFLKAEAGSGRDRVVIANSNFQIDGGGLSGFEDVTFEKGGNLQHFSGYDSISLTGTDPFYFLDSLNPTIDLALKNQSLALTASSIRSVIGGDGADSVELGGGTTVMGDIRLGGGNDIFRMGLLSLSSGEPVVHGNVDGGTGVDYLELLASEGSRRSFDLTKITGFETVSVNSSYATKVVEIVSHLVDATQIYVGMNTTLMLSSSILPNANVSDGNLTLAAGSTIGRYGFPLSGPYNQSVDIAQGDDTRSRIILNSGTIVGEVRFSVGDDLYDGRSGNVGGTVYGNAGNDTLLGGSGAERLEGGFGADRLEGNAGNDTLIGGAGVDVLIGGAGADILVGGVGADTFLGTTSEFSGDRINDLQAGDRITLTDQAYSSLSYSRHGTSLDLAGGATIDIGTPNARLILAANSTGTDLIAANRMTGLTDFNGDGHSDILWRNNNGAVSEWTVAGNVHSDKVNIQGYGTSVSTDWKIVETFDINGDGLSDLLWRNVNGGFSVWSGTSNGFQLGTYGGVVSTDWKIAGVGDFNSDGKDDILWRQDGGALAYWTSTDSGFEQTAYTNFVSADWKVAGVADFNGDGKADLLWRNDNGAMATWLGTGTGFQIDGYSTNVPSSWHIDGLGDFNGDGKDDILWRNDGGALSSWFSNGTGFDLGKLDTSVPTDWKVAAVGDYNADGKADIMWRNDNGALAIWNTNATGYDMGIVNTHVPNDWHVVAHEFLL
jgi:Ca2+-binding RTX toxin-like protein